MDYIHVYPTFLLIYHFQVHPLSHWNDPVDLQLYKFVDFCNKNKKNRYKYIKIRICIYK